MNETDAFVVENLISYGRFPLFERVPRNFRKEQVIQRASRVEFWLRFGFDRHGFFECVSQCLADDEFWERKRFDDYFLDSNSRHRELERMRYENATEHERLKKLYERWASLKHPPDELAVSNSPYVSWTPLFNLYSNLRGAEVEVALKELESKREAAGWEEKIHPKPVSDQARYFLQDVSFCYPNKPNVRPLRVLSGPGSLKGKHLGHFQIPQFFCGGYSFCFLPPNQVVPFANLDRLVQPGAEYAFLSDFVPAAAVGQKAFDDNRVFGAVWVSWYGGTTTVKGADWSVLKGKKVHYLLRNHSRLSVKRHLETVQAVIDAFAGQGLPEPTILSYLDNLADLTSIQGGNKAVPDVMPPDALKQYLAGQGGKAAVVDLSAIPPAPWTLMPAQKRLVGPVIWERTTTVVHSPAIGVGKSWFSLCMAEALARGGKLFGDWDSITPTQVLYVFEQYSELDVLDKLAKLTGTEPIAEPLCGNGIRSIRDLLHLATSREGGQTFVQVKKAATQMSFLPVTTRESMHERGIKGLHFHVGKWLSRLPGGESRGPLIVLDGLELLFTLGAPKDSSFLLVKFIRQLWLSNAAVVIVLPDGISSGERKKIIDRLGADSELVLQKRAKKESRGLSVSLNVKKGFRYPANTSRSIPLEFDPDSKKPRWREEKQKKDPPWKTKDKVARLLKRSWPKRLSVAEIADELEVAQSTVKNHMRALRLEHPDVAAYWRNATTKYKIYHMLKTMDATLSVHALVDDLGTTVRQVKKCIHQLQKDYPNDPAFHGY